MAIKILEIGTGYTSIPAKVGAATEIVVEELTRSLLKAGADAKILDIQDNQRAATSLPIKDVCFPQFLNTTFHNLGIFHKFKRVLYSLSLVPALKRNHGTEKTVLHFHNQYNFFFYDLLSRFLPGRGKAQTAYTVHSYVWGFPWEQIKDTIHKKYFMEIRAIKKADLVLCLNEGARSLFMEHFGVQASKLKVVLNGVNTDTYRPLYTPEAKRLKRQVRGINANRLALHVGSVCPRKNQLGILEDLLPAIQDNGLDFAFAGGIIDHEYLEQIHSFAQEHNIKEQVHYLGEVTPGAELNEIYNLADLFVFNSTSEAFSLAPLEAMSSGAPVFFGDINVSDTLISLEAGIKRFRTGHFYEQHQQLVQDEAALAALGAKGRELIVQTYSWDKVAEDYNTAFKAIL